MNQQHLVVLRGQQVRKVRYVDTLVNVCIGIHRALFLFGLFGLFGVFIDLDHLWMVAQKGLPFTLNNIITYGTRIFHFPILLGCGIVVCFLGACVCGLLFDKITVNMGCYKE